MKLRFTPRAVANLAEIADYIHKRNPAGARRVRAAIYASMKRLKSVILNVRHPARRREHEDA
jgi:plasmid stabilization system protein ParE